MEIKIRSTRFRNVVTEQLPGLNKPFDLDVFTQMLVSRLSAPQPLFDEQWKSRWAEHKAKGPEPKSRDDRRQPTN
jgi:hypothetical protein